MNYIDGLILGILAIVIGVTMMLMSKTKKTNCSGTCLGCSKETTCRIKNLKEDYDKDKKSSCGCH
ncbi:hypothetical protein [Anaerorhabdus sp.]|uniref:FeoB-associated Cys-rich membrane protein n=1 Tax=bioreactor metagenome TaxID=1076179 RepID=A0A645GHE2_9ZZZZ|nr:hypothetical protein [Anaerorhabdus sp.]MEA4874442.1 hypothetical protein [Anaerorhabdus sp.]